VELYAPVHAHAFRASGRITRAFGGVLAMQRQLRKLDFVTVERLELVETLSIPAPEFRASPIASPFRVE
jgi:hypothetical protein